MLREQAKSKIRMGVTVNKDYIKSLEKADEVIDKIYDEHEAEIKALQGAPFTIVEAMEESYKTAKEAQLKAIKAKDEEIERLKAIVEEAMKPKTCAWCKQSWEPNNQTFHKYFCEYLKIPVHSNFCCNRHEQKDNA